MDNIRDLERLFIKEIKKHLLFSLPKMPPNFFKVFESTYEQDTKDSFDVIFNSSFTVSVRIRKYKYIGFKDLTIRSKSKKNNKTEIDKIMEGKAQVYFYAYMNQEENKLIKIRIVDVEAIRNLFTLKKYSEHKNTDGTEFYSYLFSDLEAAGGAIYQIG
jgi:hypothetical protein